MKREMSRKAESKPHAKKAVLKGRSKDVVSKNIAKASIKNRYDPAVPASSDLEDVIFSYNSADDKNALAIIDAVRTGISFKYFDNIVNNTPFSLGEWANYLQLSERTIQRNQKASKSFQPLQSEKIVDLLMLYKYGVEVFGDKDNFNIWLSSKSVALGGRCPKELLDTKFGIDMVKHELGRIEHGILA